MKANQLLQKLGHKLLGKQVNMPPWVNATAA